MAKLKSIFVYFLIAMMLLTSAPINLFAENDLKADSIILEERDSRPQNQDNTPQDPDNNNGGGGLSLEPGIFFDGSGKKTDNANGKIDGNNGNYDKHRYDLNTIGLDKDGKPTLENIPKSLTYREFLALQYNWAGLKIDDHNKGVDRKTGEVKYAPPIAQYDVVVNIPHKEAGKDTTYTTDVYSMFGFKSGFEKYAKGEVNKIPIPYMDNYIDMGLSKLKMTNWIDKDPMGTIPAGSEIILVDYSEPGMPGHKITKRNFGILGYYPDQLDYIHKTDMKISENKSWEKGTKIFKGATSRQAGPIYKYIVPELTEDGTFLTTTGNAADDQRMKDLTRDKNFIGKEMENWGVNTNYVMASMGHEMSEIKGARVQEWHFQAYIFKIEGIAQKMVLDYNPKVMTPAPQPKEPDVMTPVPEPNKPNIMIPVPPDEDYTLKVEVDAKSNKDKKDKGKHPDDKTDPKTGHGDKNIGKGSITPKKPPVEPDKEYEIIVETKVKDAKGKTVSGTEDDNKDKPENEATKPKVGLPSKKPGKKQTIKIKGKDIPKNLDIVIPGQPAGSETEVCMSNSPKNFNLKDGEKMTKDQENKRCFKIKHGNLSDIGMAQENTKVSGEGVDTNKKTFKKGSPVNIEFVAKHFQGKTPVGTGKKGDPKVKINIEVRDNNGNSILKTVQTLDNPLQPKGTANLKPVTIRTESEGFTACAKIDESATKAGQNIANENDQACVSYGQAEADVKNYSVRSIKVTPAVYHLEKTDNLRKSFNVTFLVANNSVGKDKLPSSVTYEIYVNGVKTESSTVNVEPGSVNTVKGGRNTTANLKEGNNIITVVVNPSKNPTEKDGSKNPYRDNKAVYNLKVLRTVEGCLKDSQVKKNNNNKFKSNIDYNITFKYQAKKKKQVEKQRWNYWLRRWETYTEEVDAGWEEKTATARVSKKVDFTEQIKQKTYFRSKATQDAAGVNIKERQLSENQKGWVEFTNSAANSLIKKGNGFEIKFEHEYELKTKNGKSLKGQLTDKEIKEAIKKALPKDAKNGQYVDHHAVQQMDDGQFTPTVYVKTPKITQKGGANGLCIKLDLTKETQSGGKETDSTFKIKSIFELPLGPSMRGDAGGQVRKLYIDPNLQIGGKDNVGKIIVSASPIDGTNLTAEPAKKPLQDSNKKTDLKVRINDDVKSQIMR